MADTWTDSGDPNLALGMFALQANFVDRETLLNALQTWFSNRSRPLGEVLEQMGSITLEQHQMLRGWVMQCLCVEGAVSPSMAPEPVATAAASPPPPIPSAPRYQVKSLIASGGLGQVSLARDEVLGRDIAIKEILDRLADDPHKRARFLLEAQITSRLEHPGVVPVYDLGKDVKGRPFYAMRRIDGLTLRQAIECYYTEHPNPPVKHCVEFRAMMAHFVTVCKTMAYAHNRGIVHRDLKPENIMLGPYGEALVVDWGLAKIIGQPEDHVHGDDGAATTDSGEKLTRDGATVGTPAFMSPEQAAGDLERVGPASDIYSLGATLYQLITGKPPIDGSNLADTLIKARRGEYPPTWQVRPNAPPPVDAICQKAMAFRPEDRYPSALVLARDVEMWLAGGEVSVYRDFWLVRLRRWALHAGWWRW
jgi:serine/threonine protein kinase